VFVFFPPITYIVTYRYTTRKIEGFAQTKEIYNKILKVFNQLQKISNILNEQNEAMDGLPVEAVDISSSDIPFFSLHQ